MNTTNIIPFNGEQEYCPRWRQTFLTQADMMSFVHIMEGNTSISKDSDILTTEEQKTNRKLNKNNKTTMISLSC